MRTRLLSILILTGIGLSIPALLGAQPPDIAWERVIGGYNYDKAHYVQQTDDLGFIIVGETYSYGAGESDVYLIKTDSLGLPEWTRTFGGAGEDVGYCVQQTADYGYIISGKIESSDVYLIKTDAGGNETWSQIYTEFSSGNHVCQTGDGGYIVTGNKYSGSWQDIFLLKTDGFGQEQWSQSYGGSSPEWGEYVQPISDGGYMVLGSTQSYGAGSGDVYLIKTDAVGQMLWSQTYGTTLGEFCYSGVQSLDGGFFLGAYNTDILLVKTNALGQEQWSQTFGSSTYQDFCIDVHQTWDGNYILSGQMTDAGNTDAYIAKTDQNGNILWELMVGDADADAGQCIQQIHDGGYIIAGSCGGPWAWDVYLIRLASDGAGVQNEGGSVHPSDFALYPCHPNPFNPTTEIGFDLPAAGEVKLQVFNVNGARVGVACPFGDLTPTRWYNPGHHSISFDGSGLPSGIYFYRLTAGEFSGMGKMVLLK